MHPSRGLKELDSYRSVLDAYASIWRQPELAARCALTDGGRSISYAQLHARVSAMAGGLRAAGIQPRQRVLVVMERSLLNIVALLGVMAAGACPCPVDIRLTDTEMASRFAIAGIDSVLCDAANASRFSENRCCPVVVAEHLDAAEPYWCEAIQLHDPALLLFTSGSTGHPKGVLLSHQGILCNAFDIIEVTRLSIDDRLLHAMPLNHTNGLCNQLFSPLLVGAKVCLMGRFRAENMPALMESYRPTIITAVPTMYSRMLSVAFPAAARESLRIARCGSAPLTEELHRRVERHFGCPLIVSYGLSEATCTSVMNPLHARKIGSIGKPMSRQKVFLISSQGDEVSGPERVGEICISGPSLMLGYVGAKQGGVLEPAEDILHTGDLGKFDADGYLYITGRLKDIIIRGGENISPAEIEAVINGHEAVSACCVVAQKHDDLGEVPVAFVVASAQACLTKEAIKTMVSARLSRIHQLEDVFLLDALPENGIGKIDRKALQALANRAK